MTVLVHVKHFLNNEGIKIFPNWFIQMGSILKQQPGFISFKFAFDPQIKFCVNLWVEFSDMEKLKTWGNSNLHSQIVKVLDSYRPKPYQATRYEIPSTISNHSEFPFLSPKIE